MPNVGIVIASVLLTLLIAPHSHAAADCYSDCLQSCVQAGGTQQSCELTCRAECRGSDADLSITMTASPDPAIVGQDLRYLIEARNSGPSNATGIQIVDTLPTAVTFLSATASTGVCAGSGGAVTCSVDTLPVNGSVSISLSVRPAAGGELLNQVSVASPVLQTDPDSSNNTASLTTLVVPPTKAGGVDLGIIKRGPVGVRVGDRYSYAIEVTNLSAGVDATNVVIEDTLPQGMEVQYIFPHEGPVSACSRSGSVVRCRLGTVPNGARVRVSIMVYLHTRSADATNAVTVRATEADPNPVNNRAEYRTPIDGF